MQQHELRPPRGAKRQRKRIGRGNASGKGTYAGKGLKGQKARAGSMPGPGFEGGQTPLIRRLPRRRGFHNPFRVTYTPVNLRDLARLPAESEVTPESLREAGVVRTLSRPIKVLGDGEVEAALTVRAHRVSAAARTKIESAGGTVEELTPRPEPREKKRRAKAEAKAPPEAPQETTAEEAASEEPDDNDSQANESPSAE